MAVSPSQSESQLLLPPPSAAQSETESLLSALVYEMSNKMQEAMQNMLKMTNEIDEYATGIMEEIEKGKESAIERKRLLQEEKELFQKAAFTALNMLNDEE